MALPRYQRQQVQAASQGGQLAGTAEQAEAQGYANLSQRLIVTGKPR